MAARLAMSGSSPPLQTPEEGFSGRRDAKPLCDLGGDPPPVLRNAGGIRRRSRGSHFLKPQSTKPVPQTPSPAQRGRWRRACSAAEGAPPETTEPTAPTPQPNPLAGPIPPGCPLRLTAAADGSRQPPPPPSAGEGVLHPCGDHPEPGFSPPLQPRQRICRRATADPGTGEGWPPALRGLGRVSSVVASAVEARPGLRCRFLALRLPGARGGGAVRSVHSPGGVPP
jgi:hypothetical protein